MPRLILEDFLPYRLNRLAADISQELKAVYGKKYGLTVPEWRVLATVGQFGEVTATAIGLHSALHKTKVSRAVAALQTRRWISRKKNDADRREELISLTPLGVKAYGSIVPDMARFQMRLFEELRPGAVVGVQEALTKLDTALKAVSRKPDRK